MMNIHDSVNIDGQYPSSVRIDIRGEYSSFIRDIWLRPTKVPNIRSSRSTEHELVVVVPLGLLGIHTRLHLSGAVRSGSARANHPEPGLLEHVERLLEKRVLQEETGRVAIRRATINVSAFVQGVLEDLAAEGNPSAHEDPPHLPEFHVRLTSVTPECKRSAISDKDVASLPTRGASVDGANSVFACVPSGHRVAERSEPRLRCLLHWRLTAQPRRASMAETADETGELVELGLESESFFLVETFRKYESLVAQVVEDEAEENPVSIDEAPAFAVTPEDIAPAPLARSSERLAEQRIGNLRESLERRGVDDATDVQLDDTRWRRTRWVHRES